MNITRYSKQTGTFYPFDISYAELPGDVIEVSLEDYRNAMARPAGHSFDFVNGELVISPPPPPTKEQRIAANTAAVQAELDRQAQAKGYDNIVSACSYAAQPSGAPFQAEGAAFLKWRSDVWSQAYATLAEVKAGTRPMPTPAESVAAMPRLVLP